MDWYEALLKEVKEVIPDHEYEEVMGQLMCEYDYQFLGFLDVYKAASMFIPKHKTIIDFGCYLSAQAYFFSDYKKYIGVDVVDLKRFTPENAEHYVCSIQNFILDHPEFANDDNVFAICSYVPDREAKNLVRNTYKNCLVYYPAT